jgi:GTP cyclohydrolase I
MNVLNELIRREQAMIAPTTAFSDISTQGSRLPAEIDELEVARSIRSLLRALGQDPDREGLRETPSRVARMYSELLAGVAEDPADHLEKVFEARYDEIVLVRDIDFYSLCEHHLLPFYGKAHVAYLPQDKVVGLSKLARTVDTFARRPQLQEQLTTQIADALMQHLGARGALVIIEAEHLCMKIRGVQKANASMLTSAVRGVFKDNPTTRAEAFALLKGTS